MRIPAFSSSSTKPRWLLVLLAAFTALALVPVAFAWSTVKYLDNQAVLGGEIFFTTGYASREWNKVWRPSGYNYGLAYTNYTFVYESVANPHVDNRNAFNEQAACHNATASVVSPVTCQTTRP